MMWKRSTEGYPLKQIGSIRLKNYLKDRGWQEESFPRKELLKFRSPMPISSSNRFIQLYIPANDEINDYDRIIEYALEGISAYENRSFDDVVSQMLNLGDSLKIEVSNMETAKGSIPLPKGISMYEGVRDLFVYSACAELDPITKNFRRKFKSAINLAEKCLIGQTQYGSFVANIYCPTRRPRDRTLFVEPTSPFERRVLLRILRGLDDINDSIEADNPDPIVNNYRNGLNSNMCNALITIIEIGMSSNIIITPNLEPIWPIPAEVKDKYIINNLSKYYLEKASEILKGQPSEIERLLKGYILRLQRSEDEEEGTIELIVIDEDDPNINFRVKTKLEPDMYQMAIEAHRGKKNIRIRGMLKKLGSKWYLDSPSELEIINEDLDVDRSLDSF
jgi:hypothetical protein